MKRVVGFPCGIKLSAAAGTVLASSGLEANFKVTLTWTRQSHQT